MDKIKKSKSLGYRIPSTLNITLALIWSFTPFVFMTVIHLIVVVFSMIKEGLYHMLSEDKFEDDKA